MYMQVLYCLVITISHFTQLNCLNLGQLKKKTIKNKVNCNLKVFEHIKIIAQFSKVNECTYFELLMFLRLNRSPVRYAEHLIWHLQTTLWFIVNCNINRIISFRIHDNGQALNMQIVLWLKQKVLKGRLIFFLIMINKENPFFSIYRDKLYSLT